MSTYILQLAKKKSTEIACTPTMSFFITQGYMDPRITINIFDFF